MKAIFIGEDGAKEFDLYKDTETRKKAEEEINKFKRSIGLDKLEEMEKKIMEKTPLMDLYCLACGKLVYKNYKGQLWDCVCMCLGEESEQMCRLRCGKLKEGKNAGKIYVVPTLSLVRKDFSLTACTECTNMGEHKKRIIDYYLGKEWKSIKLIDKDIEIARDEFVEQIGLRIERDEKDVTR